MQEDKYDEMEGVPPPVNLKPESIENREETWDKNPKAQKHNGIILALIFFSFLVVLDSFYIDTSKRGLSDVDDTNKRVGIGLSMTSTIFAVVKFVHATCGETFQSREAILLQNIFFSLFQLSIWISAITVLTYRSQGIYQNNTSAGFFAAWTCLLLSSYYAFVTMFKPPKKNGVPVSTNSFINYKRGITPLVAVNIVLSIGMFVQAQVDINNDPEFRGRSIFICILLAASLFIYLILLVFSIDKFGGFKAYFLITKGLLLLSGFVIAFGTYSEPFAVTENFNFTSDLDATRLVVQRYKVVNNGFFAAVTSYFINMVVIYKGHFYLMDNRRDKATSSDQRKVNDGRHILAAFLFLISVFVAVAAFMECSFYGGRCENNKFLLPVIWLAFISMLIISATYVYCIGNVDFGDEYYLDSEYNTELKSNSQIVEVVVGLVLLLIWGGLFAGVTFADASPFNSINTGYIFIVFGVVVSMGNMMHIRPDTLVNSSFISAIAKQGVRVKETLLLLVLAFVINAFAVGGSCLTANACSSEEFFAYGVLLLVFSLLMVLLTYSSQKLGHAGILVIYSLIFLTYLNLLVSTVISGPFAKQQGNGFFSSWLLFFGAARLVTVYEFDLVAAL